MNEATIWKHLKAYGLTDAGVAGLMGNIYAESGLNPKNLQNSYEKSLGYTDETYTAAVDNGTYKDFAYDKAGYGLCQWTYWSRKQALYTFCKAAGASIGDLDTQLGFLIKELSEAFGAVLGVLMNTTSVREASDAVLLNYERPADQSVSAQEKRASYGQSFYDKFAGTSQKGESVSMTEYELRNKVVDVMRGWLGWSERNGKFKTIIDLYNTQKPLPRGYAVQYDDEWCATAVTAAGIKAGLHDIILGECGCSKMIDKYKAAGRWMEDDAYVPKIGDIIMYYWKDGADYASNDCTEAPNHVGIVATVNGNSITIIEGNKGEAVATRNMKVNGRYIRGYCLPDYKSKAANVKEDDDMDVVRFKELWNEMRKELQDNDSGAWSQEARQWATSTGLIAGMGVLPSGEQNYAWADVLTREQMAVLLYRFAKIMGKA